jgi:hypothetical protein
VRTSQKFYLQACGRTAQEYVETYCEQKYERQRIGRREARGEPGQRL